MKKLTREELDQLQKQAFADAIEQWLENRKKNRERVRKHRRKKCSAKKTKK